MQRAFRGVADAHRFAGVVAARSGRAARPRPLRVALVVVTPPAVPPMPRPASKLHVDVRVIVRPTTTNLVAAPPAGRRSLRVRPTHAVLRHTDARPQREGFRPVIRTLGPPPMAAGRTPAGTASATSRGATSIRHRTARWETLNEWSLRRVVRRLVDRGERVALVTTTGVVHAARTAGPVVSGAISATSPPVQLPAAVPVARVLHRPARPSVGAAPVRPGRVDVGDVVATMPQRVGDPRSTSGETAVSVERLTDQVVRAIDRRLVAHRERMGRV